MGEISLSTSYISILVFNCHESGSPDSNNTNNTFEMSTSLYLCINSFPVMGIIQHLVLVKGVLRKNWVFVVLFFRFVSSFRKLHRDCQKNFPVDLLTTSE